MSRFTDHLWRDLVREHGATLAHAPRPEAGRALGAVRFHRPRVLAGGTLGVGGAGVALLLALGGTAAPPAFAVTTNGNGSVTVKLNVNSALPQANAKLAQMGTGEQITIQMAQGAASVSGPVTCVPTQSASGPTVKVLDGSDGTEVISPGQTAGNTGEGTWHLAACAVYSTASGDGSGTSGTTGTAHTVIATPARPLASPR